MELKTVRKFVEAKGYTNRAERYKIEADYFEPIIKTYLYKKMLGSKEIEPTFEEILQDLMSFDRHLRTIFPEDEVGERLEKEYHHPEYLHEYLTEEAKRRIKQGYLI